MEVFMGLREGVYFFQEFKNSFDHVGSVWPTSSLGVEAIISEFARHRGPRRVLEVGPGTGVITNEILRQMRADDELVLCEINPTFVAYLGQQMEDDPLFRQKQSQIRLLDTDVRYIDRTERFDFIISTIPFVNLPPLMVREILSCYREILNPSGVLTFIEYAYLRYIKQSILRSYDKTPNIAQDAVMNVMKQQLFRRDMVAYNVPPVWVKHLRFDSPDATDALALAPLEHNRRIAFGKTAGLATDALPFLLTLLGFGIVFRRWRSVVTIVGLLFAGVMAFFRDPIRRVKLDPNVAYAAADGRVLSIERMYDTRFGQEEWLRIAVFLDITDVHMNRTPIAGKVIRILTQKGDFAIASNPAADHNHAVYTLIEGTKSRCVVAQRVGIVARRIVNWSHPDELLAQGERYGLMRFGSRIDVYLPAHLVEPCVEVGQPVVGGVTVLARYRLEIRD